MSRSPRRHSVLVSALLALLVILTTSACGGGKAAQPPPTKPSATVATAAPDLPAKATGLPDGTKLVVSDTSAGAGTTENLDFVSPVYTLEPNGPLDKPAVVTLRLDHAVPANVPVVVASRDSDAGPWDYQSGTLTSDQKHVEYTARRLSRVGVLGIDVEGALTRLETDLGAGLAPGLDHTSKSPDCAGERAARKDGYAVASGKQKTLSWCFGLENGKRVLKITNRRRTPVSVTHSGARVLDAPPGDEAWASWAKVLRDKDTLLTPGHTVSYAADLDPSGLLTLDAHSSPAEESLRLLQAGVRAFALRLLGFGAGRIDIPATVSALLARPPCAKSLVKDSDALVSHCFSQAKLAQSFGSRAALLAPLVSDFSFSTVFRKQAKMLARESLVHQRIVVRRTKADFGVFVGSWTGHTRSLTVSKEGVVTEKVSDGCCNPIIELTYQLAAPGTGRSPLSAKAKITGVKVLDPKLISGRPPQVGDTGTITLNQGVITPPFLRTTYCDRAAAKRGACGA